MSQMQSEITAAMKSIEKMNDGIVAKFLFPSSFIGFQGHFENKPVLPGVCKIQAIIAMCEKFYGKSFRLSEVRLAKYFAPVTSGQEINIQLQNQIAGPGSLNIKALVARENDKIAQFQLIVNEA